MQTLRIYISGDITGIEDFRERFLKAEKELIVAGRYWLYSEVDS